MDRELSPMNVIPFGDATYEELEQSAEALGVTPGELYDSSQDPIEMVLQHDETQANPKFAGLAERWFSPIANQFIPIVPLANAAATTATAESLSTLRANLTRIMDRIQWIMANVTEVEWNELEDTRVKKHIASMRAKEREPDPEKVARRSYSEAKESYRKSPFYAQTKKLVDWLEDPVNKKPPFVIFTKGSSKLPFFQWSTVPGATCPGAGRCWDASPEPVVLAADGTATRQQHRVPNGAYCYSINGWRQVTPFLRQLQNTVITRIPECKSHIEKALKKIIADWRKDLKKDPGLAKRVVRLFVDGDFDSLDTLEYWMHACDRHPDLVFYGYSKSWDIFLAYHRKHGGKWPSNYALNLSSGTLWEKIGGDAYAAKIRQMMEIPCVRGRFIAITGVQSHMPLMTEKQVKNMEDPRRIAPEAWRAHMDEVEAVAVRDADKYGIRNLDGSMPKIFACPGKCYACLGSGDVEGRYGKHACGMLKLRGVVIAISVHGTTRQLRSELLPATWEQGGGPRVDEPVTPGGDGEGED